jgi:hypothetical protein
MGLAGHYASIGRNGSNLFPNLEELRKSAKDSSRGSQCSYRYSNRRHPEYKPDASQLKVTLPVYAGVCYISYDAVRNVKCICISTGF